MKYLKKFKSVEDANTQGAVGLYSPHISIISGKTAVNIYKATGDTFTCTFDEDGKIVIPTPPTSGQPNDEIWYTSSDGNIVEISVLSSVTTTAYVGPELLENTYTNGKGVMKFASDVTWIGTQGVEDNFKYGINFVLAADYGLVNHLTSISLPNSVTEIRSGIKTVMGWELVFGAFSEIIGDSNELESIILSNSLTSIGEESFNGCIRLTGITIPDSVTSIGNLAFYNCSSMTTCTIGSGVTSIGEYAFNSCSSMTTCTIGSRVTSIGNSAFYNCSSLTGITIPDSVTSIGDWAFYNCSSMTTCTIGSGVTSIGDWAFQYCHDLSEVICNPTTPPTLGSNAFLYNASGRKIKVPSGSLDAYKAASGWSNYASDIISQ